MDAPLSIPSVDLNDLSSDDPQRLDRAARALSHGYGTFGLLTMTEHGLLSEEVDTYYDAFLEFTRSSDKIKAALNRPDIWYQRGWTPPNTEQAVVAGGRPDFKECYFAAPMPVDAHAAASYPELYAANIWPDNAPTFQRLHMKLGRQLHEIGQLLLAGCERSLGLDTGTFNDLIDGAAHLTRSLAYLPMSQQHVDDNVLWGEEHTDFNLLTLLAGGRFYTAEGRPTDRPDQQSGLYLRTRPSAAHPRGQMIVGRPPEGHIVSQVGQQLEILTGGRFLATPHVVKAPTTPGYARTSLAHFVHVNALKQLAPLPRLRTPAAMEAYRPPVLAGTYAIKTLVDISLAPQSTMDTLGYRHYGRLADIRAEGEW